MHAFTHGCWRLRAHPAERGTDGWLWFAARADTDLWFALGASQSARRANAVALLTDADQGLLDVLTTYAGEPWDLIEVLPEAHAQSMWAFASSLPDTRVEQLRGFSHAELRAIRRSEEDDVLSRAAA